MKFLLMIMTDEAAEAELPPGERAALLERHMAFARELHAAGAWVSAARLSYGKEATTIGRRGDDALVVDGPFVESKELLGGFYLIEAGSRHEAIEWAKKLPLVESGGVEVRPARTGAIWRGSIRGARQFAVLFIGNADSPLSRGALFAAIDAHYELSLELAAQGKFVGSRALDPSATAAALRWRNGRHVVTDGPFAESKEFVAGYFVIACEDKGEAIEWARRLMAGSDACEVRPLWAAS